MIKVLIGKGVMIRCKTATLGNHHRERVSVSEQWPESLQPRLQDLIVALGISEFLVGIS